MVSCPSDWLTRARGQVVISDDGSLQDDTDKLAQLP